MSLIFFCLNDCKGLISIPEKTQDICIKPKYSTAQKMKFSIKDFFCKCDQIRRIGMRIWSHLLKNFLMENFILCAVFYAKVIR